MSSIPNEQLVVRGGRLLWDDLEKSALVAKVSVGRPGWSVWSHAEPRTPSDLLAKVGSDFPHSEVAFATVGALREVGFEIEQTGSSPNHHSVWIPERQDLAFWVGQFRSTLSHVVTRDRADTVTPLS